MKNLLKYIFLALCIFGFACEDLVDDINDNPNEILPADIESRLFLNGAILANNAAQAGHLNRIAGMWSGQLIGITSLYSNIYGYSISTAESDATWSRVYVGMIPNLRHIRTVSADDPLLVGITKVLEAHGVGTLASLMGDVPFAEVNNPEIEDPKFDGQINVLTAAIALVESAIGDLGSAGSRQLDEDLYFQGDADKWLRTAWTLKARFHMHMKDYAAAYAAAQNGIVDDGGTMKYSPQGDPSAAEGDKNLFWTILEGSRAGDIGTGDSYLIQLLTDSASVYRGNAKTNETARLAYYTVNESGGNINKGIIEQFEPHRLISLEENLLILAEAGMRSQGFATGLGHLNDLRSWLNEGGRINGNFADVPLLYEAYDEADFAAGGMENVDGIAPDDALLREIIEERYVSGFGTYMPFDDARRLRTTNPDLMVPFPSNTTTERYPERFPYSDDELNSNSNAPSEDPGIFVKTAVNQ